MRKIMDEQRIVARDQNRVFVELARSKRRAPRDAEDRYHLKLGKGNAYVEFGVEPAELEATFNRKSGVFEYSMVGDVDLSDREPRGAENSF